MNKAQLINAVASGSNMTKSEGLGIPKSDISKIVDAILDAILDALKDGEKVSIPGFGTFNVVETKARKGRNPRTGETIQIAAKNVVRFKPSKSMISRKN